MELNSNQQAFIALVKAGLWEREVRLSPSNMIDFKEVLRIAEEQSVVGLVAAGVDNIEDYRLPQKDVLTIIGKALQLEQQNLAMNQFVAQLINKLQDENINPILLKGQGIAQCYERPLWRTFDDVDLLLSSSIYEKAKEIVASWFPSNEKENTQTKEYCVTINQWIVELHGSLHCQLSKHLDASLDEIQIDICDRGSLRVWNNNGQDVFLPSTNDDVFVVFTHIVKHFFRGGIGLRQICDWCRLLWKYKEEIDFKLLEKRLREMRLLTEWKAFAALAVEWLNMPKDAMPVYNPSRKWRYKAKRIMAILLETGNFGQNRDISYYEKYPYVITKAISLNHHTWDAMRQFLIFPVDSIIAWCSMIKIGLNEIKEKNYKNEN